ncbi:MAG TPA: DUF520 family protein [Candidatus Latescibacteria bacterium]|nr:DUF520 family protein [Candidatus Latescibacterota bacterium]
MPSFDVVSELDWHEVTNGMDQANREITNRFDFKGSDARIERSDATLTLYAEDEFKIGQVRDIGSGHQVAQRFDALVPLALEEGHVECNERSERIDHLEHQRGHLPPDQCHVVQLVAE